MVSLQFFAVLGAFALSIAAQAAESPSTLRFESRGIAKMEYQADLQGTRVTGTLERLGRHSVNLAGSSRGWSGTLGRSPVQASPVQLPGNPTIVEIKTPEGLFRYFLIKDRQGGLEFRVVGRAEGILGAHLSVDGSLSVDSSEMSFELSRDPRHSTHFEGTSVIDLLDLESDKAYLDAEGALDPCALASSDPTLFILLYLLPFHL